MSRQVAIALAISCSVAWAQGCNTDKTIDVGGTAGIGNAGGTGIAGTLAQAGMGGAGATGNAGMLDSGTLDSGTAADASTTTSANPEPGRLAGITAAHNAVRAGATNPAPSPALPPLSWSTELAKTAQAYADKLAASCSSGLTHSMTPGLGENLAAYFGGMGDAQKAVDGWASEAQCWTYGQFMQTDACDMTCAAQKFTNGCGHYTQLVWRATSMVGCGVASCGGSGSGYKEYWVCNYTMQGNYVGQTPY